MWNGSCTLLPARQQLTGRRAAEGRTCPQPEVRHSTSAKFGKSSAQHHPTPLIRFDFPTRSKDSEPARFGIGSAEEIAQCSDRKIR